MVVLADEVLESFFDQDFSGTFRLEPTPLEELPTSNSSFLSGMWSTIANNDNKKILNKLSDEVARTIGKHKVEHMPAIGRYTALEEPKARESLLTPSMRRSASRTSLNAQETDPAIVKSTSTPPTVSVSVHPVDRTTTPPLTMKSGHLAVDPRSPLTPGSAMHSEFSPLPIIKAANAALMTMERTPFAIDDAKDETDDDDDLDTEEEFESEDDAVLDEVDAFLEAHDSGLTEDQKEVAKGSWLSPLAGYLKLDTPAAVLSRSHDGRAGKIASKRLRNPCMAYALSLLEASFLRLIVWSDGAPATAMCTTLGQ
jgi:hypothetical protein